MQRIYREGDGFNELNGLILYSQSLLRSCLVTTSSTDTQANPGALRRALGLYPTGVVAVCGLEDSAPRGIPVNSFTSISLEPALVAISIARTSASWPLLSSMPRLGLSVLSSSHAAFCRQLASKSGDRFAGVAWQARPSGAVHIEGSPLWLECSIYSVTDGGDHVVVLLEVHDLAIFPELEPLVFHQSSFRSLALADRT